MTDQEYYIERKCKVCENRDKFPLTKKQKAFELYDFKSIWNSSCTKCGSTDCISIGGNPITLDKELLMEWGKDKDLHLMPQDEEILLAEESYIDLMLDLLDNENILVNKRKILTDALCIIIYDNLVDNANKNVFLLNSLTEKLKTRKHLLEEARDWIPDYVKNIVYPHIGMTNK